MTALILSKEEEIKEDGVLVVKYSATKPNNKKEIFEIVLTFTDEEYQFTQFPEQLYLRNFGNSFTILDCKFKPTINRNNGKDEQTS